MPGGVDGLAVLLAGFAAHWSPMHLFANVVAIGSLATMIAWREGLGVVAKIVLVAFLAQAVALLAFSGATEFRGASGFAYALGAYALGRSGSEWPWQTSAIALSALAHLVASWTGWVASPWLPSDVAPDLPVHVAGALAGLIIAHGSRRDSLVPVGDR